MPQSFIRAPLKNALCLTLVGTLGTAYFNRYPLPDFLHKLQSLGIAGLVLFSAAILGNRLLAALKTSPSLDPAGKLIFGTTLGLGAFTSLMVLMGVFHAWTPFGAWGLLLLSGIAFGLKEIRKFRENLKEFSFVFTSSLSWTLIIALSFGGILSFVLAFTPITFYDSLVYHYGLPATYLQSGHWVGLPNLIYSAFPQTLEMLWTFGLLLANDTVSNLLAWALSMLLIMSVIHCGKRFFDLKTGLFAGTLMILMPSFLLLSSGGYVETGLALFSFLCLYAVLLWSETGANGFALLAGLLGGWAMGTKYTGFTSVLLSFVFLLAAGRKRQKFLPLLRPVFFFGGAFLLVFSPWLIKNLIYVGNPVFPFFYKWGIHSLNPWLPASAAGYFSGIMEYQPHALWELPKLLWEIPLKAVGFGSGADITGSFGWVPFIAFLPFLALIHAPQKPFYTFVVYVSLFIVPWGMTRPVLRFLFPVVPVLALITSAIWYQGIARQPSWVKWPARAMMGLFLLSGIWMFYAIALPWSPFKVALGLESQRNYLQQKLDYYGAATFINVQLSPSSLTYIVGDQRSYYYEKKVIVHPVFSKNPLTDWINQSATPQILAATLREKGITHLLINFAELKRLQVYHLLSLSEKGAEVWNVFLQKWTLKVYEDPACGVYALI